MEQTEEDATLTPHGDGNISSSSWLKYISSRCNSHPSRGQKKYDPFRLCAKAYGSKGSYSFTFISTFQFRDIPVQHKISPKLQNPDSKPVRIGKLSNQLIHFFSSLFTQAVGSMYINVQCRGNRSMSQPNLCRLRVYPSFT